MQSAIHRSRRHRRRNDQFKITFELAWENSRHFATPPLVSPSKWRQTNKRRNQSILMTCHQPYLGSAPDWLKQVFHAVRPIRGTAQIWVRTLFFPGKPVVLARNGDCFLRLVRTRYCSLLSAVVHNCILSTQASRVEFSANFAGSFGVSKSIALFWFTLTQTELQASVYR